MKKTKPEIRFAGYSSNWENQQFAETFAILSNNTFSRDKLNYETGSVQNVHYGDVLINYSECTNAALEKLPYINEDVDVGKFQGAFLQDGDIVIADTAEDETVGKCTEIQGTSDRKVLSGLHTIPCRPKQNFAPGYLGFYLNSENYHKQLLPYMQGVKVTSISKTSINETAVFFPTAKMEQASISRLLEKITEKIKIEKMEYEKVVTLKKSLLHQMFPAKGQTKPEVRFSGYSGEWKLRRLGEIAEICGGGTPSSIVNEYWNGEIDWYAPAEIGDKVFLNGSQKKITEKGLKNSSAKMLPAGTVLFTSRAGIGNTAILQKEGCTNQGFQSIIPHKNELDTYFIFSRTAELKRYGETIGAGSTFVEVSGRQMAAMELFVPSLPEQKQIGELFRNIDEKVAFHLEKIEKLKNIKSAFMRKLFA